MSEASFTVKEFHKQVVEFRKMFGDKTFWTKPAQTRQIAVDALGFAYLFLAKDTPQSDIEHCANILQQTLDEYHTRESKLIFNLGL